MKRKFLILLLIGLFSLCGCSNIKNMNTDSLLNELANKTGKYNEVNRAFKYYLPSGLSIDSYDDYNAVFSSANYKYYLYVDVVSYEKKIEKDYHINDKAIYSSKISFEDKFGYVEINLLKNNKYLVEIMYNYAKIEVIVDKRYCNEAMLSIINILKSVEYNDSIIANLMGDDILNFSEEEFNIFNTKGSESNYLTIDNNYKEEEEKIPDTDLIN